MPIIDNPSFPVPADLLLAQGARLLANPIPHPRPVVILAGWHSPRLSSRGVESILRPLTSAREEDFLSIGYAMSTSIPAAARRTLAALRDRGLDGREIDVVGLSMGGVLARGLGAGLFGAPPVRIARLFTLASPHRGAILARAVRPDPAARDLRPGSTYLAEIDAAWPAFTAETIPYALLRDWWVGATRTAPPGMHPRWLDPVRPWTRAFSHFAINFDRRVLLDVALRLRGETPLSGPVTPPPRD